jgi:hypothetical protein
MSKHFQFVGKDIRPENFENVGHYFQIKFRTDEGVESETEFDIDLPKNEMGEFDTQWNAYAEENWRCNCCGLKITKGNFFRNSSDASIIYVGFDCANGIMKYRFDVAGAKKQTVAARRRKEVLNSVEKVLAENPTLEDALTANNKIVREIAQKFVKYGNISPKQIAFVHKLATERKEFESHSSTVPTGKVEGDFKILNVKRSMAQQPFGNSYWTNKVLIQNVDFGWKAYGNISDDKLNGLEKGSVVSGKFEVSPSSTDAYFGFFKRFTILNTSSYV